MAKGDLVFVDIETTGLDWDKHHAIEIAYQTQEMEKPEILIPWTYYGNRHRGYRNIWHNADPVAMEINKFFERYPDGVDFSGNNAIDRMIGTMTDSTLVGANVRFDARFIEKFIGKEVWHHRLFDIQAYAAGYWQQTTLMGWSDICDTVRDEGLTFTAPDHTAAADCQSVKDVYNWLVLGRPPT